MRGRFDAGLRAMRRGLSRVSILPDVDAARRKQYALASMLADEDFNWGTHPKQWQHRFDRSLKVIQQFDREFEVQP